MKICANYQLEFDDKYVFYALMPGARFADS